MKRFFRTLAFLAVATVATVSISSCKDDEENGQKLVLDPSRPTGGAVDEIASASSDAFYNGLTNNPAESTIVVDTRPASKYASGHVIGAISIPVKDEAFYYDDEEIYTKLESLDPTHSKFILLTDEGSSPLMVHVAGRLSAMGWGKTKIYLLMDTTSDFLKKHSDVKE